MACDRVTDTLMNGYMYTLTEGQKHICGSGFTFTTKNF